MEFDSINVSTLGPFSADQALLFHGGINLVQGPPGSGKTTIFRELERRYRELFQRHDLPVELAVKLVFIGEDYAHSERRGESIVKAGHALTDASCIRVYPQLISHYVNQLIAPKVMWGRSKFGSADTSGYPFQVSIAESGALEIFDAKGDSVNGLFMAMGESFLLSLACNIALRDVLGFFDPIVVDGAFGMLDESLLPGCHSGIVRTKSQCIYLLSETSSKRLPITTDYVLTRVEENRTCAVRTRA